ncbi:thiamine phosphate synthase [Trinickia acidisoli]|uniref:thiamine phosphate synthase n=1 Tax=Trinickia acidisoli TaxID=2767482 RepID=UPI001A9048E2|nr:thiamine phosphate synthase [Trinickia acidisoli]
MPLDPPLPDLLLITPEPPEAASMDVFFDHLRHAVAGGIALVQLRAKQRDALAYRRLAEQVCAVCHRYGARVVLNGPLDSLDELDADGLHLPSARLMQSSARPFGPSKLLSAACHSREQLLHAKRIGVDFVTLSPVLPTTSHPGEPTLGWTSFAALAASVTVPIYALGGMTRESVATAREHGAHGIAGISAFW